MGVAQKFHGPANLPLCDQGTDIGGGHGDAVQLHLVDDVASDAPLGAQLPESGRIALAPIAEVEVVAGHHMNNAQLLSEVLCDKIPPRHPHHPVKPADLHLLNAVTALHKSFPVRRGAEQRDLTAQDLRGRVLVEGERRRHGMFRLGNLGHPAQQRPVAEMNSVEEAQRDHPFCLLVQIKHLPDGNDGFSFISAPAARRNS